IIDKNGRLGAPIAGLPLDFSKRAQVLLDSVPDRDFARNRVIYFVYRKPPKEAGDIGAREEDFPFHYPDLEWAGRGRLSDDDKTITVFKVLLNTQGIDGRLIQAPGRPLFTQCRPL